MAYLALPQIKPVVPKRGSHLFVCHVFSSSGPGRARRVRTALVRMNDSVGFYADGASGMVAVVVQWEPNGTKLQNCISSNRRIRLSISCRKDRDAETHAS
eukprot:m.24827 g.24827  ORF g.24827 m.24827 type:complete len:100 (-) comp11346_c0_seq1:624-923(-)